MKRMGAILLIAVLLVGMLPAVSLAAQYATVVGGWLRLRDGASFNANTITSYYTGTEVEILSSASGWHKVKTPDGRIGYMYGQYLQMKPSAPAKGDAYVTSHNGYGVRLRMGPGTGYRVIRTYGVGTVVTILESGKYWSRIRVGDTVGYMMSEFLSTTASSGNDKVIGYATIWSRNGYGVRLRTGPGTSYDKIGVYSVGTTVSVLEKGKEWDRIRVGSRVGWMKNEFLDYHSDNEVTAVSLNTLKPAVGTVLSVSAITPSKATVAYEWLVGGWVQGSGSSYTVSSSDVGKTIQLKVSGTGKYQGTVYSAVTNAVISNTQLSDVKLSNYTPIVGTELTAAVTPSNASVIYAWKVGGYQVSNASSYTVKAADVGKVIELIVNGTGNFSGTVSASTAAVTEKSVLTGVSIRNVTNSGSAAPMVGDKLEAVITPAQATGSYQWKRGDQDVTNEKGSTYTVTEADVGEKISVTFTANGSYSGSKTSEKTEKVVAKPVLAPVLNVAEVNLTALEEGYVQPAPQSITITNSGNAEANLTAVSVDSANFAINTNGSSKIASGAADTSWTIQPAAGLTPGSYTATISVAYDGEAVAFGTVHLTVNEKTVTPDPETPTPETYKLTVVNGEGSRDGLLADASVEITAEVPEGKVFAGWLLSEGKGNFYNSMNAATVFYLDGASATVVATFEDASVSYQLKVNNGTAQVADPDNLAADAVVPISADAPAEGKVFAGWVLESGNGNFHNSGEMNTTFYLNGSDATVTATYQNAKTYSLGVVGGSASRTSGLEADAVVDITANVPSGMDFDGWKLKSGSGNFYNSGNASTTFYMKGEDAEIEATFKEKPAPTIVTETLESGTVGTAYSAQLGASGEAPFEWIVDGGSTPNGIVLSLAGELTGTPDTAGSAQFTVEVKDAYGRTCRRTYTLNIVDPASEP